MARRILELAQLNREMRRESVFRDRRNPIDIFNDDELTEGDDTDTTPSHEGSNDAIIKDVIIEEQAAQCGLGGLRCRCPKVFAHPNAFVTSASLLFMTMIGATGIYLSGVISTIEKRFQLKSSESGLLISMNDISGLSGVLFVTYFGGKSHRPRIIAMSGIFVALGCFVTALPQFLYDNPDLDGTSGSGAIQSSRMTKEASVYEEEFICGGKKNVTECTVDEIDASGSQLISKAWPIVLGQLFCGVGGTAILPLTITYLDDAVDKTLVPFYLAIMFLPMSVAPLIGYSVSSYCLSIFTDFYKTGASELGITPQDPQWQGAWWLGFILYGCCALLLSLPMFFFPRKMDKPKSYCCFTGLPVCCKGLMGKMEANIPMSEIQSTPQSSRKPLIIIKKFLASLFRLLTNVTYMSAVLGFCCVLISFAGLGAFAAKYIQYEFQVDAGWAGLVLGFTIMPSSLLGVVLGGILTSRVASTQGNRGFVVLAIVTQSIAVLTYIALMFMGCQNDGIAGVTAEYGVHGPVDGQDGLGLNASCNTDCTCEKGVYSPVCGADKLTYVTACFAGCKTVTADQDNKTIFQDCSCIKSTESGFLDAPTSGFAVQGACPSACDVITLFIVFLGISTAVQTTAVNPTFMLQFRTVLPKDRELAVGLSSFFSKVLGFIPSPIIFGGAIESKCSYLQESCDRTGECMLYDRPGLRFIFFGLAGAFRSIGVLFFCVSALCIFYLKKSVQKSEEDDGTKQDEQEIKDMTK